MVRTNYYVYVIGLDKKFARTKKAQRRNPDANPDQPCIYVGQSYLTPEERFQQHVDGARGKKGQPLFSPVVHNYGKYLQPKKYERYNPIATRKEALEMERKLTEKYREKGYTVWSN